MAINFIVETGEGLENSTSYVSVADMKQYWDDLGYDYSSYTDAQLQQRLNRSSRLLDSMYRTRYPGVRASNTQKFEWPRISASYVDGWYIDSDVVPVEVKNATSEMVYGILVGEADVQPVNKRTSAVIENEVQVDVIKEYNKYSEATASGMSRDKVLAVSDALSRLICTNSSFLPGRI